MNRPYKYNRSLILHKNKGDGRLLRRLCARYAVGPAAFKGFMGTSVEMACL